MGSSIRIVLIDPLNRATVAERNQPVRLLGALHPCIADVSGTSSASAFEMILAIRERLLPFAIFGLLAPKQCSKMLEACYMFIHCTIPASIVHKIRDAHVR